MWKSEARHVIDEYISTPPTSNEQARDFAAWLTIYNNLSDDSEYHQEHNPAQSDSFVENLINRETQAFKKYMQEKSAEMIAPGTGHETIADNALREMLKRMEEMAIALIKTADAQEQVWIRDTFNKLARF